MILYRVANAKYKDSTLSGIGAEKVGGRWNEVGSRAVYCSENVSLALLEYYVHSDNVSTLPSHILVAQIEVPDVLPIYTLAELPADWDQYPYAASTASVFTSMARDRNFFGLRVPSTIVGIESNFVLNPLYKDFGRVEIRSFFDLPIDPRLKRAR